MLSRYHILVTYPSRCAFGVCNTLVVWPMDPSNVPLPAFLDPLLDYLSDRLPAPLFSFVLSFLSHTLLLLTALLSLIQSLIASRPWEWDAQTIIPPVISILSAYLALYSLYRTTGWVFRTFFWFVKWGVILAAVFAGLGWYTAVQTNGAGGSSLISGMGGILNILNGESQGTGSTGSAHKRTRTTSQSYTGSPPKSWDSFDKHRYWQSQQRNGREGNDAQQIMSDIVATASQRLIESGWWNTARSVLVGAAVDQGRTGRAESDAKRNKRQRGTSR